ncbi:MAG: hypothetical protein U0744_12255 [Gemmataceae bacterium]
MFSARAWNRRVDALDSDAIEANKAELLNESRIVVEIRQSGSDATDRCEETENDDGADVPQRTA